MKFVKEILKYILVFFTIILIGTTLLTLVASIPREYIQENLEKAVAYFDLNNTELRSYEPGEFALIHTYCEEMLLNIIYCLDTDNPLESVMECKFYERFENEGSNIKYIKLVQTDCEPNAEYMRYWWGSMIFIKPMLTIFTIEQIHIVTGIIFVVLLLLFLITLIKYKHYPIAIAFVIGAIMTTFWYIPFTFEYVFAFIIMLIVSIIAINIEEKNLENKNQKLYMLFWINGILTAFFDFLTAEILTILIPTLIILTIRVKREEFRSFKQQFLFLMKSFILWGMGYCLMFVAKWIVASIVLKINAFDYAIGKAMIRVNGQVADFSTLELMWYAIKTNFLTLYGIYFIKDDSIYFTTFWIILILLFVMLVDRKNKQKMNYVWLMLFVAIVPYIRYIALANHSVRHVFMTFRCQLTTIMCYILILIYASNKEKLFSQIKKRE